MADKYLKDDSAIRTERPQLLQEAFDKHMNHQYALQWFDNEIKQLTGIDVFNEPFNHDKILSMSLIMTHGSFCEWRDMDSNPSQHNA